jgi:hypothetical protein
MVYTRENDRNNMYVFKLIILEKYKQGNTSNVWKPKFQTIVRQEYIQTRLVNIHIYFHSQQVQFKI